MISIGRCEDFHKLDLAWLWRAGMLEDGKWSTLRWSQGGYSLSVLLYASAVGLTIEADGASELIRFAFTDTPFDGRRRWLACPGCGRARRVLYGFTTFRCRECRGLHYQSQYEEPVDRLVTRMQQVRQRLGGSPSLLETFPKKPGRMRWRTYQHLRALDRQLEAKWCAGMAAKLNLRPIAR